MTSQLQDSTYSTKEALISNQRIYPQGKPFHWVNEESLSVLNAGYLLEGETIELAAERMSTAAAKRLGKPEWKDHFYELIANGWFSNSSPVYSNMGTERGLPISCFNVHISDNMSSISSKIEEVMIQTQNGGGTSGFFGELRGRGAPIKGGGESSGSVSFMRPFELVAEIVAQGKQRRGAFAGYQNIYHPDINEFLNIKDVGNVMQTIFTGVCIPDWWLEEMIAGDEDKQDTFARLIKSRQQKGLPYIFFTDNVNKNKPEIYKALDLQINASNLCSEIALPSSEDESFVCCLGSMNLELYDEWKDTDAVFYAMAFLDGVIQEFVDKTKGMKGMERARKFAERHRAVGLGVLGWHSYLQKNMIAFESMEAKMLNVKVFKQLGTQTKEASLKLAEILGHAPIFDEVEGLVKYRNTTTMTLPPTTSSSSIMRQTSPSFEVSNAVAFKVSLAKGNFMRHNRFFKELLISKGKDTPDVWENIEANRGSVQHLDFLTVHEKNVFKTFRETSQKEIIIQAAQRQKFIDQSQSLNLNIPSEVPVWEVAELYLDAWKMGVKTLYYQRSSSVSKDILANIITCTSCEG